MAEVRRSISFNESLQRLNPSPPAGLLDKILESVELRISRDPTAYPVVEGTGLRMAFTRGFPPAVPPYRVIYSVDGPDLCTLRHISRAPLIESDPLP